MKKIVLFTWILSLLAFSACSPSSDSVNLNQQSDIPENSEDECSPPFQLRYSTIDELLIGISNDYTDEKLKKIEQYESDSKKGIFRNFIAEIKSGYLYVPVKYGKSIELLDNNSNDGTNIVIYTRELYGEPWITYYPNAEKTDVIGISIMYLDDDNIKSKGNENGVLWVMNQIDSKIPYPPNEKMSDIEIKLNDRSISALRGQFDESGRVRIYFVYDDIMVRIMLIESEKSAEWLNGLSFQKISVTNEKKEDVYDDTPTLESIPYDNDITDEIQPESIPYDNDMTDELQTE